MKIGVGDEEEFTKRRTNCCTKQQEDTTEEGNQYHSQSVQDRCCLVGVFTHKPYWSNAVVLVVSQFFPGLHAAIVVTATHIFLPLLGKVFFV